MPELIIGHTQHDSATIWVRGNKRLAWVRVSLTEYPLGREISSEPRRLTSDEDYTATIRFSGSLQANTHYTVHAQFARDPKTLHRAPQAVSGELRTFPAPGDDASFSFLLGSCNLPTPRLLSIGSLLAAALGAIATSESVKRPVSTWLWPRGRAAGGILRKLVWALLESFPSLLRLLASKGVWGIWGAVLQVTRFQQPVPRLRSPFESLVDYFDSPRQPPAFMIHTGDQIYFDIDAPARPADVNEYRFAYRQAWFEDPAARKLLRHLPNYMILDDHEVIDNFANQEPLAKFVEPAMKAYREYVQCRQPPASSGKLYYSFACGNARFFVLDTRMQRRPEYGEMIGEDQLEALLAWLREAPGTIKFVVSSVPFAAQVRAAKDPSKPDSAADKWCGRAFRRQRHQIIGAIYEQQIENVVFLVGDMHCTYHATIRVGLPARRVVIHELAAGPLSQIQFTPRSKFHDHYREVIDRELVRSQAEASGQKVRDIPFTSVMQSFHGSSPAAMLLKVTPAGASTRLGWEVVPTSAAPVEGGYQPPPMRGHLTSLQRSYG